MSAKLPTDDEIRALLAPVRERVMESTREVRSPRRSTSFRVTRNVIVAGVTGLALTAGALAVVVSQEEVRTTVSCFEEATLDSMSIEIQLPDHSSDEGPNVDPGIGITDACSLLWATGDLGQPEPVAPDDNKTFPVPPLVACVQANGVGAAFPNRDDVPAEKLCESLGLAEWDPEAGV